MDPKVRQALDRDLTIDIVVTGRRSGKQRRTEIWYHRVDGRYIITGTPGRRDWYANLLANPRFTFCLKETVHAELPALARPVTDPDEKRSLLLGASTIWRRPSRKTVDEWVRRSPMVEVLFD